MEHYVTLFDSLFLPQGLALHASMQRKLQHHHLWVLCMDERAHQVLESLALPNLTPMRLADVETAALRTVRPGRSKGEYCWTTTPFAPRFVFDADPDVERVTYLDADVWFLRSPAQVFTEFEASGAGVLITEHAYAPEYDQCATAGRYCVQFMVFDRHRGEPVREWWAERCLEWCFGRYEDGKFGDQKYLDDWPERFGSAVHVLRQASLMQAPWNARRFPYSEAAIFHFHGLRLVDGPRVDFGALYALPRPVVQHVYEPYVEDLRRAIGTLREAGVPLQAQAAAPAWRERVMHTLGPLRQAVAALRYERLRRI